VTDLETFEKGGAIEVPIGRIEAELAALWRAAASHAEKPVTRACLWNFFVRCVGDADFKYGKQLIDDISQRIPARVIVLRPEPGLGEGQIRSWVEANWRRDGHGASGSDEVTLVAGGKSVERMVSLVRALTITDAPTAMMWIGALPDESAPVRMLLKETDRLIVDSRKLPSEAGLAELARIDAAHPDLEVVDLSWLGVSPLRGLLAAMFDPPQDPTPLERLERVRVTSGVKGPQTRALLCLGWLGARLGWSGYRRVADTGGAGDLRRWSATRRDGGTITVELATQLGGADHGVVGLELFDRADTWSLGRDRTCIDVRAPGLPQRLQPARSHSDAELTVSALGPRGRDKVFHEALAHAARLVES
jgi:glucose-6-phosphate dehydrogenase assembly protein OpcA